MYEQHFRLSEKPFSLMPDPDFLYLSDQHESALSMLEYGLHDQTGITIITGEVGAGKTILVRYLLRQTASRNLTVGLISYTQRGHTDVLKWVASAFDIPHQDRDLVSLYRDLEKFFVDEYANNRRVVLIIDEAQNFDADALEELRLLSNINSGKDHLVQVVLIGQPELFELLQSPELSQLAQRVSAEYHIKALSASDTVSYIQHRLSVAGGSESIFTNPAEFLIYYFSAGIPRMINNLCDLCLVYAYGAGEKVVDVDIVFEVVKSKRICAVVPTPDQLPELQRIKDALQQMLGYDIDVALQQLDFEI